MFKRFFAYFLLPLFIATPAFADDAIFSNNDTAKINLQPATYSKPIQPKGNAPADSNVSEQNFINAINNLDNAQVEIREQLANYNALMVQAKTNYEAQKNEYKAYKKQYNAMKKKMNNVEKSKKLIQSNVYVQNTSN